MDRSAAQAWLDAYVEAWKTYDRDQVAALFAEDATYRYHPYDPDDETVRGLDAIVRDWIEPDGDASTRDEPGTYDGHYEPWAVDGNRVAAVGWSRYWTDATRANLERTYLNVFLIEFDGENCCRTFVEYYMKEPGAGARVLSPGSS